MDKASAKTSGLACFIQPHIGLTVIPDYESLKTLLDLKQKQVNISKSYPMKNPDGSISQPRNGRRQSFSLL